MKLFPSCYSVGHLSKRDLTNTQLAELNEIIPGAAVDILESYSFKKICFRKKLFYSIACTRVKRRNSFTVTYLANDADEGVGEIDYFMKIVVKGRHTPYFLAAVHQITPSPDKHVMANVVVSTVNKQLGYHLKPFISDRFAFVLSFTTIIVAVAHDSLCTCTVHVRIIIMITSGFLIPPITHSTCQWCLHVHVTALKPT